MSAATLPEVDLGVDLDDEVACDIFEDVECDREATYRITWTHEIDSSRCAPNLACIEHAAEVRRDMHDYEWPCEHDTYATPDQVMPL